MSEPISGPGAGLSKSDGPNGATNGLSHSGPAHAASHGVSGSLAGGEPRRFADALTAAAARTEAALERLTPEPAGPRGQSALFEAMRYAVLGGGKRLRGFLALEVAQLFGVPERQAERAAAAVECLHAYSLVHDDMPCMDDDDLRRGKPTVHRAFDEATAVLAGDALQTLAFEILAAEETHARADVRVELVARLAAASGGHGMVGGQAIDLAAETAKQPLSGEEVARLQALKTGVLIEFAAEAGAILGEAAPADRARIVAYARDLGAAFQIADDLLDVEGDAATTGKRVGKDAEAGKATFVDILGVDGARKRASELADSAAAHLAPFGPRATALAEAASFVVSRNA